MDNSPTSQSYLKDGSMSLLSTVALLFGAMSFKEELSAIYLWNDVTVLQSLLVISLIMTFITLLYLMTEWQKNSLFEGMFGKHLEKFIKFLNTCRMMVLIAVVGFVIFVVLLNFIATPPVAELTAVLIAYVGVPITGYYLATMTMKALAKLISYLRQN